MDFKQEDHDDVKCLKMLSQKVKQRNTEIETKKDKIENHRNRDGDADNIFDRFSTRYVR